MNQQHALTRRRFLRSGLLASGIVASGFSFETRGAEKESKRDHGLKLGITTYTLRKFTLDQAIAMTKEAELRYMSLKDMHLPLKSTPEERRQARKKIEAAGLVIMGCGVIYMKNDEQQIRNAFEYAKDARSPTIICSPEPDALDQVEKFAKQYRLRIAIHNHGPGDKHYPSPLDVWRAVKDRDQRMGLCIDVGHTIRNGEDAVAVIKECATRLYDFHMKDVNSATANGEPVEVGKGVIDIPSVLKALVAIKYQHNVALEYEAHADDPMPGVKGSVKYMREVLARM